MGLQDIFTYSIKTKCSNCGYSCNLRIKKGVSIADFAKSQKGVCNNCGCPIQIKEFQTNWLR